MDVLGYLLLAGVVGFVGWRFYLQRVRRNSSTGGGAGRPPRGGGSKKQR